MQNDRGCGGPPLTSETRKRKPDDIQPGTSYTSKAEVTLPPLISRATLATSRLLTSSGATLPRIIPSSALLATPAATFTLPAAEAMPGRALAHAAMASGASAAVPASIGPSQSVTATTATMNKKSSPAAANAASAWAAAPEADEVYRTEHNIHGMVPGTTGGMVAGTAWGSPWPALGPLTQGGPSQGGGAQPVKRPRVMIAAPSWGIPADSRMHQQRPGRERGGLIPVPSMLPSGNRSAGPQEAITAEMVPIVANVTAPTAAVTSHAQIVRAPHPSPHPQFSLTHSATTPAPIRTTEYPPTASSQNSRPTSPPLVHGYHLAPAPSASVASTPSSATGVFHQNPPFATPMNAEGEGGALPQRILKPKGHGTEPGTCETVLIKPRAISNPGSPWTDPRVPSPRTGGGNASQTHDDEGGRNGRGFPN
ncbi:unnamed protein product, partial [Choristocarpus tenellus]